MVIFMLMWKENYILRVEILSWKVELGILLEVLTWLLLI